MGKQKIKGHLVPMTMSIPVDVPFGDGTIRTPEQWLKDLSGRPGVKNLRFDEKKRCILFEAEGRYRVMMQAFFEGKVSINQENYSPN